MKSVYGKDQLRPYDIRDNSSKAKFVIVIFWVLILFNAIAVIAEYVQFTRLQDTLKGSLESDHSTLLPDLVQFIFGVLQIGLFVISIVVFLNWFRSAYDNLHMVGKYPPRHTASMAVWAWFIPIVSFFRPVKIMKEIWEDTQIKIEVFDKSYQFKNGGFIIGIWWFLFLASNFIGRYITKTAFKNDTIEELILGSQISMLFDAVKIIEALLVIFIIKKVARMETKLRLEVVNAGGKIIN